MRYGKWKNNDLDLDKINHKKYNYFKIEDKERQNVNINLK